MDFASNLPLGKRLSIQTLDLASGKLGVIEGHEPVPFQIKRLYFLYSVPADAQRGAHAHKDLQQFFIAINGSFRLKLDSGDRTETHQLSSPSEGLLIGPGLWRELSDFSEGAVCLVIASAEYDERDYFRDYDAFLDWVSKKGA